MQRLFVYGSLAPGRSHHHLLSDLPGHWQPATCTGFLLPGGFGMSRGWPAFKPDPAGTDINGYLFTSGALSPRWSLLDRFEGRAYRRVRCQVRLADGSQVSAWLYRQKKFPRALLRSVRQTRE